jgi:tRNA threonylcarbamoyladenosine biosynthesis protein TsaE
MSILGRTETIQLFSEEETANFAKKFALAILPFFKDQKTLICWLIGDLGAGKTTLTRYLLKNLGHEGKVKSPTYTLCEPYQVKLSHALYSIHHFDLYRMNDPREWEEAGFRDTFTEPGLCLVEWPEKAEGTLPVPDITLHLEYANEDGRTVIAEAHTDQGLKIIQALSSI